MTVIDPQTWRDAEDGRALRELREALPSTRALEVGNWGDRWWVNVVDSNFGGEVQSHSMAATIHEAADKVRAEMVKP